MVGVTLLHFGVYCILEEKMEARVGDGLMPLLKMNFVLLCGYREWKGR